MEKIDVIINSGSGNKLDGEQLRSHISSLFDSRPIQAEIFVCRTKEELVATVRQAIDGPAQTIVAGGGDGTISLLASLIIPSGKALGVLPLGTFNYFARNMSIPLEIEGAVDTIVKGHTNAITVGKINDRVFLNNASLGLYPQLISEREKIYSHVGRNRIGAYIAALLVFIRKPALLKLRLRGKKGDTYRRTPLLFVYNNEYQMKEFAMPGHERVEAGQLAFCLTSTTSSFGLLKLAVRGLFRRFCAATDLEVLCLHEAVFDLRRKEIPIAVDGEVLEFTTPLHFQALPAALRVLIPRDAVKTEILKT